MRGLLTTQEAAELAGVGPTAIKRWADSGVLRCVRTAGGHRRFAKAELTAFLAQQASAAPEGSDEVELFLEALLGATSVHEVEALLIGLRGRYGAWFRSATFVAKVLVELGARWAKGELTIIDEHLTSERLHRAIGRIAENVPVPPDAPVVLLATVEGDEHLLGLALVELCFRECGLGTRWPGRATPVEEVIDFIDKGGVEILAVSASATAGPPKHLRAWLERVKPVCEQSGVDVLLGGEGRWPERANFSTRMRSFDELHAFLMGRQAGPTADRPRSR